VTSRVEGTWIGDVVNRDAIDQFTFLHLLSGILWYAAFRPFPMLNSVWMVLIVSVGWELAEPMAKEWNPDIFPNPSKDSTKNKVFDVLAMLGGWLLARWMIE
jgi:hypothetical protein